MSEKHIVKGEFEVKTIPGVVRQLGEIPLAPFKFVKTFTGELNGESVVEMISTMSMSSGARLYVALENFKGSLMGKEGSIVFTHKGVMSDAGQSLAIDVVPELCSGDLSGLNGSLSIEIKDGKHFYEFEYWLT